MKNIIYIFLFLSILPVFSQSVGDLGSDPMMMGDVEQKLKKQQESMLKESPASTGFVNPMFYYLGPGDVIFLKSFPALPQGELLTISPDGLLLLPRNYGVIDIKNKSLEEVTNLVKENVKSDNVQISLYKSKNCVIDISGDVFNEKVYTLPGTYKISDLYKIANTIPEQSTNQVLLIKSVNQYRSDARFTNDFPNKSYLAGDYFKERNIKIIRDNGDVVEADLIKSLKSENFEYNPYLMPGDKVIVTNKNYDYNIFQIRGAVSNPATVQHKDGDRLSDLVKIAGGLTPNADLNNVVLYTTGNKKTPITIDNQLNINGDDPVLEPNSILIIGEKPVKKPMNTGVVTIMGEVNNPGAIIIENGKTKISDVIELAGGLKETAYLPLAKVLTKQDNFNSDYWELYREDVFFQYSDLSVDDTLRLNIDAKIRRPYLAINFEDALKGSSDNVALNDGDKIIIPENPKRVYVFGKVYNPGFVEFKEGKSYKWYIDQVGGSLPSAHLKRIRIIRGNNFTWVEPKDQTILYAGDMIYIPSHKEISEQAEIQKWATYTSIGVSIVNVLLFIVINVINLRRN
jgi:protein involved in polysaccharide export with SLBB domain